MKNILFIILLVSFFHNCGRFNKDKDSNEFRVEIKKMIDTHCQELNLESLKNILSENNRDEDKDFLRYFVFCFSNDIKLEKYILTEKVNRKKENIYSILLAANITNNDREKDSYIRKAKKLSPNNLYLLYEELKLAEDSLLKSKYLQELNAIAPNNELVIISNIENYINFKDTLRYYKYLDKLKKTHDNYYSNRFIANEYLAFAKIDSAVLYYNKSLKQKETVGILVDISSLSLFYYDDIESSESYLEKAKSISHENEDVLYLDAWLKFKKGDTLQARKSFEKLLSLSSSIENRKAFLLFLLSSNKINLAKKYYLDYIIREINPDEKAGYFLVFEKLTLKNEKDLNNYYIKADSVQNLMGLSPLNYSNNIMEVVLESIHKWK